MKKVTFQHEEGNVFFAVELDQDRLQDELDCSCEDLATASKKISRIVGPHEKQQMQNCAAPSGKSVTAVQLMRRSVSRHGGRGRKHTISNARPLRRKKTCCPTWK